MNCLCAHLNESVPCLEVTPFQKVERHHKPVCLADLKESVQSIQVSLPGKSSRVSVGLVAGMGW